MGLEGFKGKKVLAEIMTMIGTIAGLLTVGPIVLPWLVGTQHWLHRQSLRLGHASRHTFVVWTRNINIVTAAIVLAVFIFTAQLFFRAGVSFPFWCWAPPLVVFGMMVMCRIFDHFVMANGTGTTDRHVLKTLGVALGGTFAVSWHLRWVGCQLKQGLDHRFPEPQHIDWVVDVAQDLGLIALFLMVTLTAIWSFVLNWSAAILRVVAQFEYFVLGVKNTIVAGLRPDKDIKAYIAELKEKFPHGDEAATMIFIVNTINQLFRVPAFVLLDTMLVIYWMDFGIAKRITVAFLAATAAHLIWTLARRDARERITVPPWYTLVAPFGLAAPYIGYWMARGPYRESLGQAPVFHEIGEVLWRLTHMPPITALFFLLVLCVAVAGLAAGGKKLDEHLGLKNPWVRYGLLVGVSLLVLPVIGGQLYRLALVDIATPAMGVSRHWSASAAWDTGGKPLLAILLIFALTFAPAGWRMAKEGEKFARIVAVPALFLIALFGLVTISAGYMVDVGSPDTVASNSSAPPTSVSEHVSTNRAWNCTPAWRTPNTADQCCAGLVYDTDPSVGMCVTPGYRH